MRLRHPGRPDDKPNLCSIHVPNPYGKVTELSVLEAFNDAELGPPDWNVIGCD
jgi:hypothetical protein